MKKIIQECNEMGLKQLELVVTNENISDYSLYEKLGFKVTKNFLVIILKKANQFNNTI